MDLLGIYNTSNTIWIFKNKTSSYIVLITLKSLHIRMSNYCLHVCCFFLNTFVYFGFYLHPKLDNLEVSKRQYL
jgi:hypothetical protein